MRLGTAEVRHTLHRRIRADGRVETRIKWVLVRHSYILFLLFMPTNDISQTPEQIHSYDAVRRLAWTARIGQRRRRLAWQISVS